MTSPMITRIVARDWLLAYMNREIDAASLADWARKTLEEGWIYARDEEIVRRTLLYLRRLDSRAWGLTWDELHDLMQLLGYEIRATATLLSDEEGHDYPADEDEIDHRDSAAMW